MNIRFHILRRWRKLARTVFAPEVLPGVVDDSVTDRQAIKRRARAIISNPDNVVLAVSVDRRFCGCFVLYRLLEGTYEVHTLLLKQCRGTKAVQVGRAGIRYVFGLPFVQKLTSFYPEHQPATRLFARLCGFKDAGRLALTWKKGNERIPVHGLELTRSEFLCHSF